MTDYTPTSDDQQIAVFMLAQSGLKPDDIARHLGLNEQQVRRWLAHDREQETA